VSVARAREKNLALPAFAATIQVGSMLSLYAQLGVLPVRALTCANAVPDVIPGGQ
jgi:hypothetical protein